MIIDTHAHLYLEEFEKDIELVINNAQANNVSTIYLPAINSETHEAMVALAYRYPSYCKPMIGLHPCYVKADYENELKIVDDYLSRYSFSGIGECGLDFYWDKTFVKEQYFALEFQIQLATKNQLPIILHTRNATQETINVIRLNKTENLKGIFHCFGGTIEEAQQIIELDFYVGIGGVVTYKNSGLDKVLENIDLKHIVLETDAPYLTPVPHRGKRNETAYLKIIAEKIASIKNCSFEEVSVITSDNAMMVFEN